MSESREHIRNRMLQMAARSWGYPETEAETSFDPLVGLLLSVQAAEFERVSAEIHQSRARVLERMVELLSPETLTGPLPSHAVLAAGTLQDNVSVSLQEQFVLTQKLPAENGGQPRTRDLFFTPTGHFAVNRSNIRYVATAGKFFQLHPGAGKELLAYNSGEGLGATEFWLGIDQAGVSLDNAQFYFQIRNEVLRDYFYAQLPAATWYADAQALHTHSGFNDPRTVHAKLNVEELLQQPGSIRHSVLRDINELYKSSFITIRDEQQYTAGLSGIPTQLEQAFSIQSKNLIETDGLRWIRIVFPENVTAEMLEDVSCYMNCFPVVNRRLQEITYRMQELVNIIPLLTDDLYFDLEEVTDQDAHPLHVRELDGNNPSGLHILLRSGGVGRFDERDAASMIGQVLQLLRDESAAFSRLGRDFVAGEVKQLQQIVNRLEQQMRQKNWLTERTPYLLIRSRKQEEVRHLFVKYWSVNGRAANDIKAGTPLMPYRSGALDHNRIVLLTATRGGRDRLMTADAITAYKSAVLSRDRVMSLEDVRLFCMRELGQRVSSVDVQKGVMVSLNEAEGFVKTIDVTIRLHRKDYREARERNEIVAWEKDLAFRLADRSLALMPYRIFIEEAA